LSTRLGLETKRQEFTDWAEKEWNWFLNTGMINNQNLVNDGLNSTCQNNGDQTWTYNQGVILGGLVNLYNLKKDKKYVNLAMKIALAACKTLVYPDGILHEPCEPSCGNDGPQFKGIFVRYIYYLAKGYPDMPEHERQTLKRFIQLNANTVWKRDNNVISGLGLFGLVWKGPSMIQQSCVTQTSVLDLFLANVYFSK